MREALHFDAVVIGAGTAGLTAATRLAQAGAQVCVLAKGVGSTHLAPGTIDVLGYAPERVDAPGPAIAQLAADRPTIPMRCSGLTRLRPRCGWFAADRRGRTARPDMGMSAAWSATSCCPPRSARCARRRWCPRRCGRAIAPGWAGWSSPARRRCVTFTRICAPTT